VTAIANPPPKHTLMAARSTGEEPNRRLVIFGEGGFE